MKIITIPVLLLTLIACNQPGSSKKEEQAVVDTVSKKTSEIPQPGIKDAEAVLTDSASMAAKNARLLQTSVEILKAISSKDMKKFSTFVHPVLGVRFSPYAHVDTANDQKLTRAQLISLNEKQKIITWGMYDGREEPIKLNMNKYFKRFVYEKNYLDSAEKLVNEFKGGGNSLNNLKEVYPFADFVEFYVAGTNPDFGGMDWRLLRLVFKTESNHSWLIAVVHDEWTI